MMNLPKRILALFLLVGLFACDTTIVEEKTPIEIKSPLPELAKKYEVFEFDPSQEQTFTLATGTEIYVPANSLVNANGEPVTGKVQLKYREYHDAVDVLLSGIPMEYKRFGDERVMQTAGMFDIVAEQNGEELFIAADKRVRVDMASYEEGDDYSFFKMDKSEGWQFIDHLEPKANSKRKVLEKEVKKTKEKIEKLHEGYFVFSYDALLDIYQEMKEQGSVGRRRLKDYKITTMQSSVYEIVRFEQNKYPAELLLWKKVKGKRFPKWLTKEYADFKLKSLGGSRYKLTAKSKGRSYAAEIEVVAPLKYLLKYSPKQWKKQRTKIMKEIAKEEERYRIELKKKEEALARQAMVIRSFELSGFGIYNYDRLMREDNKIEVLADFKVKASTENLYMVFFIPGDNKTLIKYPKQNWEKVALLPDNAGRFLAIGEDQSLLLYTQEEYKALAFESLRGQQKPKLSFGLGKELKKINTEADLRNALEIAQM